MSEDQGQHLEWHVDGHRVFLRIEGPELVITGSSCPFEDNKDEACFHPTARCLVRYYIAAYGLEVNISSFEPVSDVEIAWALQGTPGNYDLDLMQVWIVSLSSPSFKAWYSDQTRAVDSEDTTD